ncbi:sorbosone dehydrogenase family protein [Muricauda sp. 2012CJ35-5]|uniref:Sorbosone dehydrogenase family protein n=1 Tax=Flagellimonas spongiicola TaxID=2942208 RepID=A0ABT0PPQ0_9FLAO|nr:sorbosone dehydrogenase family protein [Allomuricauda spongiicola]MCL6273339.1 sorbosone dehydrogenase family protein [Allomuricauda spongiicola]
MIKKISFVFAFTMLIASCNEKKKETKEEVVKETMERVHETSLPLDSLQLPEGFKIEVFAEGVDGARSMAMGDDGTLFVGTRNDKTVYALRDEDGDFWAEKVMVLDSTLEVPNGIAYKDGDLYVAEVNRLLKYSNIEANLANLPEPEVIYDDYPTEFHHGWKYIAFGPDGKLYVPVGAPCNICDRTDEDERFNTITRMDPDGSNREIYARGVRNTVGFTWHPETDELWFTDNGRDMLGDDIPPCELNRVAEMGQHFGYPHCHGSNVSDPEFGKDNPCANFVPPVQDLGAHVAPLGVKFYTGTMFPSQYKNQIFLAEHGSWNRSSKVGYRVMMVTLDGNKAVSYEPFIDGWLNEETQDQFGRPVDLLFMEDGSMLLSDDFGDAIYRVSYVGV